MSSQTMDRELIAASENPAIQLLDARIREMFLTAYGNQKTKRAYGHSLTQFRNWLLSLPGDYKSINLISDFRAYLHMRLDNVNDADRLSEYTVSLYMAVVKRYVKFLHEKGMLEFDPGAAVKGFRRNATHNRRALDRNNEVPLLLDTIAKNTRIGKRDYAMISILVHTGLRGFELVAADYGDLDCLEGRPILWVRSKGKLGKSEYVFITDNPLKALSKYLSCRKNLNSKSALFATIGEDSEKRLSIRSLRERVDYWLKRAGLKGARVTTHSLRHTAAIAALKNGADIRAVQGMLRHSDPKTTMVYLQDISRQDKPAEDAIRFNIGV